MAVRLDRGDLIAGLRELVARVEREGLTGVSIEIIGGAALRLAYIERATTVDIDARLEQISGVILQLDDSKVPRNIRKGARDVVDDWLLNKVKEMDIRIAMTQNRLEELYEDPNIPMEFGTLILQINTALEQLLGEANN